MNFKIKHQNRINYLEPGNTSNAMMNQGAGDPPQKKGTATTEPKLETMYSIYESKLAEVKNMKGPGRLKAADELRKMSERIKATPGGIDLIQSKGGYVATGSESGKPLTTSDISKMTGKPEEDVKKKIMRQTGAIVGERIRKGNE